MPGGCLAAENQVGKLGYGSDANEQIGDRAQQIVPAVEWLEQRHSSVTFLRKDFAFVTAGEKSCGTTAGSRMPRKDVRVNTANSLQGPTQFFRGADGLSRAWR